MEFGQKKLPALLAKHKQWSLTAVAGLAILLAIVHVVTQPQRSVANFCKVWQQEDRWLAQNAQGTAYSSGIFPQRHSSNAGDFVTALSKLEPVAPKDVEGDVHILRLSYQKIQQDPSQTFSAVLGGIAADDDAANWVSRNCGQ